MLSILQKELVLGIFICIINTGRVHTSPSCPPAEENEEYPFSYSIVSTLNDDDVIRISTNKYELAMCTISSKTCILNENYGITINFNVRNMLNITIRNISQHITRVDSNRSIYVTIGKPLKGNKWTCNPKIFYKAKALTCDSKITEKGVNIRCAAERIYPQGRCQYVVVSNESLITVNNITENHMKMQENPTYFKTLCSSFLTKSIVKPGKYDVNVTIYPHVNNEEILDFEYGTNFAFSFILDIPGVKLINCPPSTEEGKEVTCTCVEKNSNADVSIRWYHETDEMNTSYDTEKLILKKVNRTTKNLYCISTNRLGWKSRSAFYKLNILYNQSITNLTIKAGYDEDLRLNTNTPIFISCEVEGNPFPEISIFVGPRLIYQTWASSSPFTLELPHYMICGDFTDVSCSALQRNKVINKTAIYNKDCPPRLISSDDNQLFTMNNVKLNNYISVMLKIYCHPKPKAYSIIKNGSMTAIISNVTDGNANAYGFIISYVDEFDFHTGSLNLTFAIKEQLDYTNYLLIIDNGINPPLKYYFLIQNGGNKGSNVDIKTIIIPVAIGCIFAITGISFWIKHRFRGKVISPGSQNNNARTSLSFNNEEKMYEVIELNDAEDDGNALIDDRVNPLPLPIKYKSEVSSSNIDESSDGTDIKRSIKQKRVIVRSNQYDMLGKEEIEEDHNYKKPAPKLVSLDSEYLTVIDEPSSSE